MFLRPGSSFSTPQITTGTPGLELAESPRNILSSTVLLPSLSTQKATDTMKALLTTENSAPTALMLNLLFIKKGWSVVSATAHHQVAQKGLLFPQHGHDHQGLVHLFLYEEGHDAVLLYKGHDDYTGDYLSLGIQSGHRCPVQGLLQHWVVLHYGRHIPEHQEHVVVLVIDTLDHLGVDVPHIVHVIDDDTNFAW